MMVGKRKGFIQVVEVGIASFFLVLSLSFLFGGISVKLNWEKTDLVSSGKNIFNFLIASRNFSKLLDTQQVIRDIEKVKPINVKFGLEIYNTPAQLIKVGCPCSDEEFSFVESLLTPTLFNDRWINFTVEKIEVLTLENITDFDVLVFVNFTEFDDNTTIQEYLKEGGAIVAITDIKSQTDLENMNDTFYLEEMSPELALGFKARYDEFYEFEPLITKIPKYWVGFGFDIICPYIVDNKNQGYWWIWQKGLEVNITSNLQVEIEYVSGQLSKGDLFVLNPHTLDSNLPNRNYVFRIKEVTHNFTYIQCLNRTFPFVDFLDTSTPLPASPEIKVKANYSIIKGSAGLDGVYYTLMSLNLTTKRAVWISHFPKGDDYKALVKAAIASMKERFYLVYPRGVRESVKVSSFLSPCCDVPEIIKVTLDLWYKY
jgi:hypothetical protein